MLVSFHTYFVYFLILLTLLLYITYDNYLEKISLAILSALLLFFHFFPVVVDGENIVNTTVLLSGFSNPALLAVIALLILGQAIVQTGALNKISNIILKISNNNNWLAILISLITVMVISAFMNNTPVVIVFIPILTSLVKDLNIPNSKIMIPLSYVAILGGMTTLIGSSTNIMVSGILDNLDLKPLTFFAFSYPGVIMSLVGLLYIIALSHKLLPNVQNLKDNFTDNNEKKQFISQLNISKDSNLIGRTINQNNQLAELPEVTIQLIKRNEKVFLPPFQEELEEGDILIVSSTRKQLFNIVNNADFVKNFLLSNTDNLAVAEVAILPHSNIIDKKIKDLSMYEDYNCSVIGVKKNSTRINGTEIKDTKLKAGDILLISITREKLYELSNNLGLLVTTISKQQLLQHSHAAKIVNAIFIMVATVSALNIVPISISSITGVVLLLLTRTLTLKQLSKAIDMRIILMIATSIALGTAMNSTGGAALIAHQLVLLTQGHSDIVIMSALFIVVTILTNVLSNNATAVLFTPIAVKLAQEINLNPEMFLYAVIFACNCSFITPIGYQTNLLVMSPGNYRFQDYIKTGLPLAILMWLTYTIFCIFNKEFFTPYS